LQIGNLESLSPSLTLFKNQSEINISEAFSRKESIAKDPRAAGMYHDESPNLPESGLEQGPVVLLDGQDGASGEDHELNAARAAHTHTV